MGKGSKDLAGGGTLHLTVAMAYGKGVILAEDYQKMSGCYFADLSSLELWENHVVAIYILLWTTTHCRLQPKPWLL